MADNSGATEQQQQQYQADDHQSTDAAGTRHQGIPAGPSPPPPTTAAAGVGASELSTVPELTMVQSPDATDTRRTSMSSRDYSMQASIASMQSQPGDARPQQQQQQPQSQHRSRPNIPRLDYGSMRTDTSSRSPVVPPTTPRRPTAGRRNPSSAAPHRGEVFSVDDDPEEVDSDLKLARTQSKHDPPRERERQVLRRKPSTVRRRPTALAPTLRTVESDDNEEQALVTGNDAAAQAATTSGAAENGDPSSEETLQGEEEEEEEREEPEEETPSPDEDEADLSDAESFTLKDRQEAINETHPFGIRIWKPALYKKDRSVQRNAEGDIHSAPGGNVSRWLFVFNCLWTVIFGWWLALIAAVGGVLCMLLSFLSLPGCYAYGRVLINASHYLFYPFGKYVQLERDEAYLEEDEGEGRSISEYERWQTGDLEEGRLFFGPTDINRSIIGRRRDEVEDLPADETDGLLGRQRRQSQHTDSVSRNNPKLKKRLFGRGKWNIGRVIFFLSFYFLITPCLFLVSGICWFLVFTIPMGKVTLLLFYHLRRHPLALSFHTDRGFSRAEGDRGPRNSSILLCTYRAVGMKYWKYTIDGTNIFLINLLGLVVFVIFDYFVLYETLGIRTFITSQGLVFVLALASIIPLAYFIGQAVASISAQSSMGVGATINAFFSTVVEVFLYCVALKEGKSQLVEGSIIGSIFAGILFLPGLSMCFGALKRKTQRFNVRSAGVTSTMLLFAVIGAFGPTLFYQIYGSHELVCRECTGDAYGGAGSASDCRRCYFRQVPDLADQFYTDAVQPYIWFASVCLFFSYVVGLMFTLRTHAAVIWNNEPDEKKDAKTEQAAHQTSRHEQYHVSAPSTFNEDPRAQFSRQSTATGPLVSRDNIRDSQLYKRILNQSLKQAGLPSAGQNQGQLPQKSPNDGQGPFLVPPKTPESQDNGTIKMAPRIQGLSAEDNRALVQEIAEMAATAATVAARDATKAPRRASIMATTAGAPAPYTTPKHLGSGSSKDSKEPGHTRNVQSVSNNDHGSLSGGDLPSDGLLAASGAVAAPAEPAAGGHDAPNWSRTKSAVILLTATVAYAVIAEILVDTVDAVLSNVDIDEKFLGITLFALVPNTTEFLNAISFAMNGNVALSMEIGSSYALQVMLLQIPALVLFSAFFVNFVSPDELANHSFSMLFPQWDMVTVILGVFLMGWVVGEGKSNYFKGSTLILSYLVVAVGFWFSGYNNMDTMGVNRLDTLALGASPRLGSLSTMGQGSKGLTY